MIKSEDVDSGNIYYPSNSDKILMSDNTTLSAWVEETEKRLSEAPPSSGGGEVTKLKALSISVNSAELCKYDGSTVKSVNIVVPEPVVIPEQQTLAISINGTEVCTYDGAVDKSLNIPIPAPVEIPDQKMLTVMVNSAEVCKYNGKLDKTVSITIPEPAVIPEQKTLSVTINGTETCKYDGKLDKNLAITIPEPTVIPEQKMLSVNVNGAEACKYDGSTDKTLSITIPEPVVIPEQKVLTVTINGTEACKYDGSTDKSVAITIPAAPDPHEETKAINVSGVLLTGTTSIKLIEALISPTTQSPIILPYKGSSGLYVESVESGAITITTDTIATEDIKVEVLMILSTAPHNPTPTP